MSRRLLVLLGVLALALGIMAPIASAQEAPDEGADEAAQEAPDPSADEAAQEGPDRTTQRELPASVEGLRLGSPLSRSVATSDLAGNLVAGGEDARVIIRLKSPSVAEGAASKAAIESEQAALIERVLAIDSSATVLAQVQLVLNAVFIEVSAAALAEISEDQAVLRVAPVGSYQIDLTETIPYIGAAAVHADGYDGTGIRVAVLDSGIDYYHANLGGSGDPADYAADDPTIIEAGTFPTAKVVGGYDFVGSAWLGTGGPPEAPDEDPIDDGPGAGHGTHVGHIIAGVDTDSSNPFPGGVAPGADLYAVKVCSSISTACSGMALIQGMEFAVDPDGDGKTEDAVDIINMSLGSPYGQPFDDDLSQAVDNATSIGVLTVASAGNSSDKPYVVGSPSAAPTALSVAQTAVPSAFAPQYEVTAPASIAGFYDAVFQAWSVPLTSVISGPVQYGDGAGGNLNGCAPFAPGSLSGMIVLVDRGACNFTLKISNISQADGLIGIIGLIAPGDPFDGGDGGDRPIDIPGYMISQADSNTLKSGLPDTTVKFDPAVGAPLIGSMVGSSSRGPQDHDNRIKPEIGAPGASVSAIAGSGTGLGPFGGTSGAAPMVSGSAALLLQSNPGLEPLQAKALLMNTADADIINKVPDPALAPITRIGGGEVRVDRAVGAEAYLYDHSDPSSPALSFGLVDGWTREVLRITKEIRLVNLTDHLYRYKVSSSFRDPDDEGSAVEMIMPSAITLRPGRNKTFNVTMVIRSRYLPANFMNSGSVGADPAALNMNEFDGYITLDNGETDPIHIPWHVLARKSAMVRIDSDHDRLFFENGIAMLPIRNRGEGTAQVDSYSLIATSPNIPEGAPGAQSPTPDIRAVGVNTFPVPAGFCSGQASFVWAFAVNTWERQSHLLPVSHQIILDTDQDGTDDYVVLNRDVTFSGLTDGRQLTWAVDLATGNASAFFFAEHATNTANTAMYICGEQVGLTGTDMLATNVDIDAFAQDWYFGGPGDFVEVGTITPLGERYFAIPEDLVGRGSTAEIPVIDFGCFPGNTDELGILLYANGDRGAGNRGAATHDTEALLSLVADATHWGHIGEDPPPFVGCDD